MQTARTPAHRCQHCVAQTRLRKASQTRSGSCAFTALHAVQPARTAWHPTPVPRHSRQVVTTAAAITPGPPTQQLITSWVEAQQAKRLNFLEDEALDALKKCVDNFQHPVFPCALIAGDVALLHLLHRLGYLSSGRVKVAFIDTLHLFPETYSFLGQLEELFDFQAVVYKPEGFNTRAEYKAVHGSDLPIRDIDEYDRLCKVEPFQRALRELQCDVMINGRRRDHGADRAFLEIFESKGVVNCNAIAYWTFKDCFDYLAKHSVPYHPLHDDGYPSVGDEHSTLPVPREKWFEYGGERKGRFQGFKNADGSAKTECGIHSSPVSFASPLPQSNN